MVKNNSNGFKSAEEMAKLQREISVSEFFIKNRHLLGFDNPRKALLTAVKEGVDNSLDACEEGGILPELFIKVTPVKDKEDRFNVIVEDNGPGIVKEQIPKVFGKLLYGSKFHKLRESRGQQGIGVSAVVMYAQLTTGKPAIIVSKTGEKKPAHYYELRLNTKVNEPEIIKEMIIDWEKSKGTKIEVEIEAKYQKGRQSVDEYLKQVAIANPHASITYIDPFGEKIIFPNATKELPIEAKEIKPHPYGIEIGALIKMLSDTKQRNLKSFLINDFCRVSNKVAEEIILKARLNASSKPATIARKEAENLYEAIKKVKIMAPPTNCLSPIGEELIIKGLKKEINAEFYTAVTRPAAVYRGFPFLIEIGLSYGGSLNTEEVESIKLLRYANRVPLLYQPGACAITESVVDTAWRNYGIQQSKNSMPNAPMVVMVHIASVWVPFTSESKEAIAHYPEIIKEVKLGLQEAGRKLGSFIRKTVKAREQKERVNLFEKYIPEVASSLANLSGVSKSKIETNLLATLERGISKMLKGGEMK